MTYVGKGQWACLIVLVIMIVILLNAEGCAELILRNDHIVYGQKVFDQRTGYYLSEDTDQEDVTTLP